MYVFTGRDPFTRVVNISPIWSFGMNGWSLRKMWRESCRQGDRFRRKDGKKMVGILKTGFRWNSFWEVKPRMSMPSPLCMDIPELNRAALTVLDIVECNGASTVSPVLSREATKE